MLISCNNDVINSLIRKGKITLSLPALPCETPSSEEIVVCKLFARSPNVCGGLTC